MRLHIPAPNGGDCGPIPAARMPAPGRGSRRGQCGEDNAGLGLALCDSPIRNRSRDPASGRRCPTGPTMTPRSVSSCGRPCPTPGSRCATARVAAVTTAIPVVECRPTRPVRADPLRMTTRTVITTTTADTAERPLPRGGHQVIGWVPRGKPGTALGGGPCDRSGRTGSSAGWRDGRRRRGDDRARPGPR